jgi:hypothetical protein
MGDGFDAAEIIFKSKVFVGSMRVFVRKAEADEHARNLEGVVHLRDEGYGAAFADKDGFFSVTLFESGLRDLENRRFKRSDPRLAGAEHVEFALDGFRQKFADLFFDEGRDFVRILMGNKTRGEFRVGFRRNDGFSAFALIAAPNAIQLERWPRPKLFDDGETFFTGVARRADGFLKGLFLPRQPIQRLAFGCGDLCDSIVEAWNVDLEILAVKLRKQFGENRQRIGDRTAVDAGVEVTRGAGEFDLVIIQSAQAIGDRRHAFRKHRGVRNDQRIGFELFFILLHVVPEADASDFLLAFDQDFYVDGQLSVYFLDGFERFQVDVDLTFVIGRAAAEKISAGCTS